jgi:uncharacterized protein (TIGR01777 family)
MNTTGIALWLMAAQGVLGAFDTVYHHELTEALPQRRSAQLELRIHALRAVLYAFLFIGLAAWEWHGWWVAVLLAVFSVEIVLTLWDFVVEDKTRLLPATERVTHTILAINGGAFITLIALSAPQWFAQATALVWAPHGWLSGFLALCGVGVGISGVRDAFAAASLKKSAGANIMKFSEQKEVFLITGATGFIGQQLVRAVLDDGHQVHILTRKPKQAAWLFEGAVTCIGSMADLPASTHIDVVINLAGARILGMRWTEKRKAALRRSRVALTTGVVDWIARAEHKPRLMISASAIGYYGVQDRGDDSTLTEASPPQPVFMSQLCAEWEAAARQASQYGTQVVCTRLGLVLGEQGALPMMAMPIKLGLGGPLGGGKQWLSWIHVQDVLGAFAFISRTPHPHGTYNLTAPDVVRQAQFSATAASVLHRPCFVPTPGWPMRLLLGEQADLLLEGQRVVPAQLQEQGYQFVHPKLDQALASIFRP